MPGDVDHVVYTAQNAEIAVRSLHGAVTREVWPVTPVFALRILVVFLIVLADKTLTIAIDRLEDSRPWIANANVSCFARTGLHFLSVLIKDDGIDSGNRRTGTARLHGIERRFGAAQEAAVFGLPPGVHDHSFTLADDLVIPLPDCRLDRFTDRGHVLEVVVVFLGLVRARFAQHTDGRGPCIEDVHIKLFRNTPGTSGIGIVRYAFIKNAGCSQSERAVNDIRMSSDPADIGQAPIHVFRMYILSKF